MIFMKWMSKLVLIASLSMLMVGCNNILDDAGIVDQTVYPPAYPIYDRPIPKCNGSIYQAGREVTLFDDRTAKRVGDILTVRLEETTQGQKKAKTKTQKIATNNFPIPILFGGDVHSLNFQTATDQQFNGEGEANQQNKLFGSISVTVVRVLANNNLVIQGESWLTINQGREYVRLSGIVRREDIDPSNTISSRRVADARITYSGNGQVANVTRGGILTQLLNKFFPY